MSVPLHESSTIDGIELHWAEVGEGRPLVLLHGLSDSHRTWHRVAREMSCKRRVLMLDLPGHGLSGRPDASYQLDWHADVVGAWMDHLGLDDVDFVGHSFGGGVAQFLLLSHAERIRRLCLVASGGLGREVSLGLRLLSLPGAEYVVQPFLGVGTSIVLTRLSGRGFSAADCHWQARVNSTPGSARALVRTVRGVIDLGGQHRQFLDRAHEVERLPAIAMFWGEHDDILPVAHGRRVVDAMEGVELTTFADCGHFPHLQQPEQFLASLSAFLFDEHVQRARVMAPMTSSPAPWLRRGLATAAKVIGMSRAA
jgi:pimeloyl-ACP methyl ester carboxylesterase